MFAIGRRIVSILGLATLLMGLLAPGTSALAVPTEVAFSGIDWETPSCNYDPEGDISGAGLDHIDLVGDDTCPAAFYAFDENYAYFRVQVVASPFKVNGTLENHSWVAVMDFMAIDGYDYMIGLTGQNPNERVAIHRNGDSGRQVPFLMNPTNTDSADDELQSYMPVGDYSEAIVSECDVDYWFVSWAVPMDDLIGCIADNDPSLGVSSLGDLNDAVESGELMLYFGTSADHNNYNKDVLICYGCPTVEIVADPEVICEGSTTTLTAETSGCATGYQWYEGDSTSTGTLIPGATEPTFETPDTLAPGDHDYTVEVTCDETDCSEEASATITVVQACETPSSPDFTICVGTTLNDQLFFDNGVTSDCGGPECCDVSLNYPAGGADSEGSFQYTVTCDCEDGPCPPAEAIGTVTVVDCQTTLTVCKTVVNDNGGTFDCHDFTIVIKDAASATVASYDLGDNDEGDCCHTFELEAGTYTITETGPDGYTAAFSGDASSTGEVTLVQGDSKSAVITNDDDAATVTLHKTVEGGDATEDDFTPTLDGDDVEWETSYSINAGQHAAGEHTDLTRYVAGGWTGDGIAADGSFTAELGQEYDFYVTNTYVPEYAINGHKYCCSEEGCTETGVEGWEIRSRQQQRTRMATTSSPAWRLART